MASSIASTDARSGAGAPGGANSPQIPHIGRTRYLLLRFNPVMRERRLLRLVLAAAIVAGVALRAWMLTTSLGTLDADEAVWGLMARHVLDGELSTFYWGQTYGGTLEVLLTAPGFAVLGPSTLAVRGVPALLVDADTVALARAVLAALDGAARAPVARDRDLREAAVTADARFCANCGQALATCCGSGRAL